MLAKKQHRRASASRCHRFSLVAAWRGAYWRLLRGGRRDRHTRITGRRHEGTAKLWRQHRQIFMFGRFLVPSPRCRGHSPARWCGQKAARPSVSYAFVGRWRRWLWFSRQRSVGGINTSLFAVSGNALLGVSRYQSVGVVPLKKPCYSGGAVSKARYSGLYSAMLAPFWYSTIPHVCRNFINHPLPSIMPLFCRTELVRRVTFTLLSIACSTYSC
jgi:hypothetical protein